MWVIRWKHGFAWVESKFATWYQFLMPSCHHNREGTNIKVRVEIETQPRGARQSSLSSILSSRSLSVESLGHSKSQSHDYPCASELEERREGGAGDGEEQDRGEIPGGDGAVYPVFETDSVWGPPVQASYSTGDRSAFSRNGNPVREPTSHWDWLWNTAVHEATSLASTPGPSHQLPCSSKLLKEKTWVQRERMEKNLRVCVSVSLSQIARDDENRREISFKAGQDSTGGWTEDRSDWEHVAD